MEYVDTQPELDFELKRHQTIKFACFGLAGVIIVASAFDLRQLVARPAKLDRSFQVHYDAPKMNLPAGIYQPEQSTFTDPGYTDIPEIVLSDSCNDLSLVREVKVKKDGLIGFADQKGQLVIKPQFREANQFSEGLASAKLNHGSTTLWGYIDTSGRMAFKPMFDDCGAYRDGIAAVHVKDPTGGMGSAQLIDKKGRVIISTLTPHLPQRFGNVYAMPASGLWGLVNKQGKWLVAPEFSQICVIFDKNFNEGSSQLQNDAFFSHGAFEVKKEGATGVLTTDGKSFFPSNCSRVNSFNRGIAGVVAGKEFSFVNSAGHNVFDRVFSNGTMFDDMIAVEDQNHREWRAIDLHGNAMKDVHFDSPIISHDGTWLSDGMAAVWINEKIGYLNSKGRLVIEPKFLAASSFKDGYARVWDGSAFGFINKKGEFVSGQRFGRIGPFKNGVADVTVPGPLYLFDQSETSERISGKGKIRMF